MVEEVHCKDKTSLVMIFQDLISTRSVLTILQIHHRVQHYHILTVHMDCTGMVQVLLPPHRLLADNIDQSTLAAEVVGTVLEQVVEGVHSLALDFD